MSGIINESRKTSIVDSKSSINRRLSSIKVKSNEALLSTIVSIANVYDMSISNTDKVSISEGKDSVNKSEFLLEEIEELKEFESVDSPSIGKVSRGVSEHFSIRSFLFDSSLSYINSLDMADSIASSLTENFDDPLLDIDNEKLYNLLEDTLHGNELLEVETEMFENYLDKVEPQMEAPSGPLASSSVPENSKSESKTGASAGVTMISTNTTPSHSSSHELLGSRVAGRKRSKSRSSVTERTVKLSAEQKCDIAQRITDDLRVSIEVLQNDSERILYHYKAVMEESECRMAEIKKDLYEFERDIGKSALNPQTNNYVAEKINRYLEEKLRTRDTLIEKLRLKNATLKVAKKKLVMQLKQKEEMGEILHEVDFNQLKIENQQYVEKIDERNQDLLRLKLMAGNTLQILNAYKKKLATLTSESEHLRTDIGSRHELLRRIAAETEVAQKQRDKAHALNSKLRQQLSDYQVPAVMIYVNEKATLYDLKKICSSWERKVEIVEMALKTNKKAWRKILVHNQWQKTH